MPYAWLLAGILVFAPLAAYAQTTFSASGTNPAAIQSTVDAFRAALGVLNPNVAGSAGSGRREINWDGVPDASSAPNNLPADFFNVNSPRGVVFSSPGGGFQVSATAASGTPVLFGNINASYPTAFQTFSPQRLFTALGSNIVDVTFLVPGSNVPALSKGFGAVFTDVDVANGTSIQLFNSANNSLGQFFVPATTSGGLSFLGIVEPTASIGRIRIIAGNAAIGSIDSVPANDIVVMDDFIYGEPVSAPLLPVIAQSFGAASIGLGASTPLSFTLTNPNASATLNDVSFTDTLPAGLIVATPNGLSGTCGNGTITAAAGSSTIRLTGVTAGPSASCTFSVNVMGTSTGVKNNSVTADSAEGAGNAANASVTVTGTVTITKVFGRSTIVLNDTTVQNGQATLDFTITNPNALPLTGVAFNDTLPSGIVLANNPPLGNCGSGTIGTTPTTLSLTGGTIPGNGSCLVVWFIRGTSPGVKTNSVTVSANETGQGNTSTASITVVAPATIAKVFGAGTVPLGSATTLTFTVTNPNAATTLTGVGFVDSFPSGLVVATPVGLTGTCGGGTITAAAGSGSVRLTGASLEPGASCTFAVNVTSVGVGQQNNVTSTVTSTQGGDGAAASASLIVLVASGPANVPTLGESALVLLGLLLSLAAAFTLVGRAKRSNLPG